MREHVDNNGYNDAFQSDYRPRHSTETATALVRIHNDLMQSMDCRRGVLSSATRLKANIWEIFSDTHQLHYIPLHHFTI